MFLMERVGIQGHPGIVSRFHVESSNLFILFLTFLDQHEGPRSQLIPPS